MLPVIQRPCSARSFKEPPSGNSSGNSLAVQWLEDSTLSLPRARVQSLTGELKSHKPRGTAEKKKKEPPSFPRPTEERAGVFSSGWRAAEDEI